MALNTYTPIASTTLTSTQTSVSLQGIFTGYDHLVLNCSVLGASTGTAVYLQFNTDTSSGSTNYSYANDWGGAVYGSAGAYASGTQGSERSVNVKYIRIGARSGLSTTIPAVFDVDIMGSGNTTTYTTVLSRCTLNSPTSINTIEHATGTWRSTAQVTTVNVVADGGSFAAGSTFALYGLTPMPTITAKATGGVVSTDSTYTYHTFAIPGSFTFVPTTPITADVLVVAGGGGGGGGGFGNPSGGGGGAGGLQYLSSQSLSAISYSLTVGSGGAGGAGGASGVPGSTGSNGTNSQFSSLTASVGGGGGGRGQSNSGGSAGNSGGSGGGAGGGGGATTTPSGFTSGQGNAGGAWSGSGNEGSGGGGAGSVGLSNSLNGNGGSGLLYFGNYYAGGGGGGGGLNSGLGGYGGSGVGGQSGGASGTVNGYPGIAGTGSGGGAGGYANGAGGAGANGVIIVRYAS
jgi:hypothetical protein